MTVRRDPETSARTCRRRPALSVKSFRRATIRGQLAFLLQSSDKRSACSITNRIASSCLSGGYL